MRRQQGTDFENQTHWEREYDKEMQGISVFTSNVASLAKNGAQNDDDSNNNNGVDEEEDEFDFDSDEDNDSNTIIIFIRIKIKF